MPTPRSPHSGTLCSPRLAAPPSGTPSRGIGPTKPRRMSPHDEAELTASASQGDLRPDLLFGLYDHLAFGPLVSSAAGSPSDRAGASRAATGENLLDRGGAEGHRRGTRDRQDRTDRATLGGRVGVAAVLVRGRPSIGGFSLRHTSLRTSGPVFSHHRTGSRATATCRHWRFSGPAVSAERSDRRGREHVHHAPSTTMDRPEWS